MEPFRQPRYVETTPVKFVDDSALTTPISGTRLKVRSCFQALLYYLLYHG